MAIILLLGSDRDRSVGIRNLLRGDGHHVVWQRDIENWRMSELELRPELVVAGLDSLDPVVTTTAGRTRGFAAPLLWIQQDATIARDPFLDDRLVDRISCPFLQEELLARVDALIRTRAVLRRGHGESRQATRPEGLRGITSRLSALLGSRGPKLEKPLGPYLEVAARLAEWADRRDAFEPGHSERVTSCCAMISDTLGLPAEESSALLRAALLHDIGKVALPVEILRQKEPLEEGQLRLIRTHPRRGAALARALDGDDDVADTVLYHHERPDGSGYYGKKPENTPRTARVLAVAEVYEGLTNSRLRPKLSREEALEQLEWRKGSSLDTECVEALVHRLERGRSSIPFKAD